MRFDWTINLSAIFTAAVLLIAVWQMGRSWKDKIEKKLDTFMSELRKIAERVAKLEGSMAVHLATNPGKPSEKRSRTQDGRVP